MGSGNRFLCRIGKNLANLKISSRIMLIYGFFVIFSLSLSSIIYQSVYYNAMVNKISEVSMQNLQSLEVNVNALIENADYCSNLILSDPTVQDCLTNSGDNFPLKLKMSYFLRRMMAITPNISAIFIMDNFQQRYFTNRASEGNLPIEIDYGNKERWFPEIQNKKGGMVIKLNGGNVFLEKRKEKFLSCMKIISNIESQIPIGMIIINISEHDISRIFGKTLGKSDSITILRDENDNEIIPSGYNSSPKVEELIQSFKGKDFGSEVIELGAKKHLLSYLKLSKYDWKLISIIPFAEVPQEHLYSGFIFFAVIIANGILIFIISVFMARTITKPIDILLRSMKENERGELKEASFTSKIVEFSKLRDGYNAMIIKIKELLERIIKEQRTKRKAELEVLHAQVKPHFLYNTIDTINSLAMMGKNEEVCTALTSLGQYYRTSLSKGREVITVEEEIETVKNYLAIQKIRYGDIFTAEIKADPSVLKYDVLKLVLQPLAENSLYHGIKPKGEQGSIMISASLSNDTIVLTVEDDGVGMDQEVIDKILVGDMKAGGSFGLRGTIERLRIFYDRKNVIDIISRESEGTKIIITVPIKGEFQ